VVAFGLAVATLSVLLATRNLGDELDDDRAAMYDAAFVHPVPARAISSVARAAMLRHPAEPYIPFVVGARALNAADANPIPWIGGALDRASIYGPAHLVLARTLSRRSPSQARLEYRLAMEQMPESAWVAFRDLPAVVGGYYDALEVAPAGKVRTATLESLADALKDRLPATRVELDTELVGEGPALPSSTRIARDAVEDLEHEPWCEGGNRAQCLEDAMHKIDAAILLSPDRCEARVLKARAQTVNGEAVSALKELDRHVDSVIDRVPCLKDLALLAMGAGVDGMATSAIDKVASAGCNDDVGCRLNITWAAQREEARGNRRKALALYKRAHDRVPDDDPLLEKMARLASDLGLHVEAAEDFERLARRHPDDVRWKPLAQEQRVVAERAALGL
jgi:tetratricopeptide (TPR) repeat protein